MRRKDIQGYEGLYSVSSCGSIFSLERQILYSNNVYVKYKERKLKNQLRRGYLYVALYKNRKRKDFSAHRIVAAAFIKKNNHKNQVNHINGIKTDNRVENLEWCTPLENTRHAINAGFFSEYPTRKSALKKKFLTAYDVLNIRKMLKNGEMQRVIANKYDTSQGYISQIKHKKKHVHIK